MNKKILLSTILASLVMSTNYSALGDQFITYNPTTAEFLLNGTADSVSNIITKIKNARELPRFKQEDVGKFMFSAITDFDDPTKGPKLKQNITELAPVASFLLNEDEDLKPEEVLEVFKVFNLGFRKNIIDKDEIKEFLRSYPQIDDFGEAVDYIQQALTLQTELEGINKNTDLIINNYAANNNELNVLVNERKTIENTAEERRTDSQKARIKVIENTLIDAVQNDQTFIENKKSPKNQEVLKKIQKIAEIKEDSTSEDALETKFLSQKIDEKKIYLYLSDPEKTNAKDLPEVQKSDTHTASSLIYSSVTASNVITDRVAGFTGRGIASGEAFQTFGAWVKGSFSQGEQKSFKSEPGFKFNQKGVTIGVDTGDESMIGVAGSLFKNDVSNKSSSSAKDETDTYLGSIYGMQSFSTELFLSGQFSYGKSNIKKSRATGDLANNKASAKTTGTLMGSRAEVGYVYPINNETLIVPTVGFGYNKVDVKGYTESGEGLNRTVGEIESNRTSGIAGVAIRHLADMGTMKIIPEIHANVDYAFTSKNSATKITVLEGLPTLATPSEKTSKAFYNIGASVKVGANEMFDVTASYDLGLSKKFMAHTGALKLRVNF